MPEAKHVRVLTWNLRHGGGRRMPEIVLSLLSHKPDLVVLTEFHSSTGGSIRGILADAGLVHQATSATDASTNAILIASRVPLQPCPTDSQFPAGAQRLLEIWLPSLGAIVSGVHVPDDSRTPEKLACWHFLIALARDRQEKSWILLGDFNSGRHRLDEDGRRFRGTALLGTFSSLGMLDAWRHLHPDSRERSWAQGSSKAFGGASRIDACYLSKNLHKCLKSSHFSHAEREAGASDHSALIVDLEIESSESGHLESFQKSSPGTSLAPGTPSAGTLFAAWKTQDFPAERWSPESAQSEKKDRKSAELPIHSLEEPREPT